MSGWISINDELPAIGSEVVVTDDHACEIHHCFRMSIEPEYKGEIPEGVWIWWNVPDDEEFNGEIVDAITHWMPLPEPPNIVSLT